MAAFHNRSCVHSWSARFEMKKFALLLVAIAATAITQAQLDASTGLFPIVEDVIPTFDVACSPVTHCIDAGYENLTAIAEGEASAFWRSPSTTARVNITMDLHGVHELVGFEMEMLRLPKTAVLLRSLDGQLFEPYQYYAYDCLSAFDRMPDVAPESTEEAVCVSSGSSPSDDHGFSFNPLDSKRPPTGSQRDYFNNDRLQAFVRLRYLRISFLAYHGPDTAVDVFGNPLQPLPFYEITSLRVLARCFCNGHASSCEIMTDANGNQQSMCACQHNTMGPECQMCQPLFNNRPYQAGRPNQANECLQCDCHGHAASCAFDASLSAGSCDACQDNTSGFFCEACAPYHFRNSTNLQDACIACTCNERGALSQQCAKQTGKCICKARVTGFFCDECAPGSFGFGTDDMEGCKDCACNAVGSNHTTCDRRTGQCPCKIGVTGKTCTDCLPGFYPGNVLGECLPCHPECGVSGCIAEGSVLGFACRSCRHVMINGICEPSCPEGYWNDNSVCKPCDQQCRGGCSGPGPSACTACVLFNLNGTCVNACPPHTYISDTNTCLSCSNQCTNQGCIGPGENECHSCRNFAHQGSCVASCPNETYADVGKECRSCHPLCSSEGCRGATSLDCLSCVGFKRLLATTNETVCIDTCDDDEFADERGYCRQCHAQCKQGCTGAGPQQCDQSGCRNFLLNNTCVATCPTRMYAGDANKCEPCSQACDEGCWGPGDWQCFACAPNTVSIVGISHGVAQVTCGSACPPGTYTDSDRVCRPCDPLCSTCGGPEVSDCTSCQSLADAAANRCVATCPLDTFASRNSTNSTFAGVSLVAAAAYCYPCDPLCEGCTGPSAADCIKCRGVIFSDVCLASCPNGTYLTGNTCAPCSVMCRDGCSGPTSYDCFECARVRSKDGSCRSFCGEAEYADDANVCRSCHTLCSTSEPGCSGPDPDDCHVCGGVLLTANGSCQASCPFGTYVDGSHPNIPTPICTACHAACNGCVGPLATDCLTCKVARQQGICVEACPPATFLSSSGVCLACHPECGSTSSCVGPSAFDCRQDLGSNPQPEGNPCLHVQLDGQCIASCPVRYTSNADRHCVPCHETCATCNGPAYDECTSCPRGFFLKEDGQCQACHALCRDAQCTGPTASNCTAGCLVATDLRDPLEPVCVLTCPLSTYLSASPLPDSCLPCHAECAGACTGPDASQCLACAAVSSNGTCVATCPPGTAPDGSKACLACHSECEGGCVHPLDASTCTSCARVQEDGVCVSQCSTMRPFLAKGVCLSTCPVTLPYYNDTRDSSMFMPSACVASCDALQDPRRVFIAASNPLRCTTQEQARQDAADAEASSTGVEAGTVLWIVVIAVAGFLLLVFLVLYMRRDGGHRKTRVSNNERPSTSSPMSGPFNPTQRHPAATGDIPPQQELVFHYNPSWLASQSGSSSNVMHDGDNSYLTISTEDDLPAHSTHV
eukprot:m.159144 g.159144  ORF g.159144 m.159144 type:complete len:1451 (-) comp16346_c0_seq3:51-4403(-)